MILLVEELSKFWWNAADLANLDSKWKGFELKRSTAGLFFLVRSLAGYSFWKSLTGPIIQKLNGWSKFFSGFFLSSSQMKSTSCIYFV